MGKILLSIFVLLSLIGSVARAENVLGTFMDGKVSVASEGILDFQSGPTSYDFLGNEYWGFDVRTAPNTYPLSIGGTEAQENFDIILNISLSGLTQPSLISIALSYSMMGQYGQYPWEYFISYDTPLRAHIEPSISACGSGEGGFILYGGHGGHSGCSFVANSSTSIQVALKFSEYQIGRIVGSNMCDDMGNCSPWLLDDVGALSLGVYAQISAVPEPHAFAMLLVGLVAVVAVTWVRLPRIALVIAIFCGISSNAYANHPIATSPNEKIFLYSDVKFNPDFLTYEENEEGWERTGFYFSANLLDIIPNEQGFPSSFEFKYKIYFDGYTEGRLINLSVLPRLSGVYEHNEGMYYPYLPPRYLIETSSDACQLTDYACSFLVGPLQKAVIISVKISEYVSGSIARPYPMSCEFGECQYWTESDFGMINSELIVSSIPAVPEPQAYALMLAGFAVVGLCLVATRSRKRIGLV